MQFRYKGKTIQTEALSINISNIWVNVLQKFFADVSSFCLDGNRIIVPCDYHKEVRNKKYWEMIEQNIS